MKLSSDVRCSFPCDERKQSLTSPHRVTWHSHISCGDEQVGSLRCLSIDQVIDHLLITIIVVIIISRWFTVVPLQAGYHGNPGSRRRPRAAVSSRDTEETLSHRQHRPPTQRPPTQIPPNTDTETTDHRHRDHRPPGSRLASSCQSAEAREHRLLMSLLMVKLRRDSETPDRHVEDQLMFTSTWDTDSSLQHQVRHV